MRTFLLAAITALCIPLSGASLTLGPERPASVPASAAAVGDQSDPAVASDGRDFFTIWYDSRLGGSIFGARIDRTGQLLDQDGVLIDDGATAAPSLLWTGVEYAAVWLRGGAIDLARVSRDGKLVAPVVEIVPGGATAVRTASTGRNLMIAWSTVEDVRVQIFSLAGEAEGAPRVIPRVVDFQPERLDDLTASSNRYLLVTVGGFGFTAHGWLLDDSGGLLRQTDLSGAVAGAAAASDDSSFLIVSSTSSRHPFPYDLSVIRLTADGDIASKIVLRPQTGEARSKRVVWTGSRYEVIWPGRSLTVGADGQPGTLVVQPQITTDPAGASNGERTLIASVSKLEQKRDFDLTGHFLDDGRLFPIGLSAIEQAGPVLAWNGRVLMTAWLEINDDAQSSRVLFNRFVPGGEPLDGPGVVLSEFGSPEMQAPAIASDGDTFLVAWTQADGVVKLQRIDTSGFLMEGATVSAGARRAAPTLAFSGTDYVLAFGTGPLQRVSRVGIPIGDWTNDPFRPRVNVVWTGTHYVATLVERVPFGSTPPTLHGQIIAFDNVAVTQFPVSGTQGDRTDFTIASNGESVLMAWQNRHAWPADIKARLVSPYGEILDVGNAADDGLALVASFGDDARPSVAWDGTSYVLAWQSTPLGSTVTQVLLQRISPAVGLTGSPLVVASMPVFAARTALPPTARWVDDSNPTLLSFDHRLAVAYVRPEIGVNRVFVRISPGSARTRAVR